MTATEALAESWASINAKLDRFYGDFDKLGSLEECRSGYMIAAAEMITRLKARGFDVTAVEETNR